MNTIKKGKRIEREVELFFQRVGYSTFKPAWNRFGQKDVFNTYDIIIARRKDAKYYLPAPLLFIQIKSTDEFYTARKKVKEWISNHCCDPDMFGVLWRKSPSQYFLWLGGGEEREINPKLV